MLSFSLLLLLQNSGIPEVASPLASGGIAAFVIWAWRQDRGERERERKAAEDRYTELAKDFRHIVQENTRAVQQLSDALTGKKVGV